LLSRYVARTPPLEARSPGRRSNVENASITCWSLISNAHAPRVNYGLRYVAIATQPVHRLQIRPIVHRGSLYHAPKLHPGPCSSVGVAADRQTDTQTRVTTIHFASSTNHAKCNECQISTLGLSLSVHRSVIPASVCPAYQLDQHVACRRWDAF